MNVIIDPGSRIAAQSGNGWTNTYDGAASEAQKWLRQMQADGLTDIVLTLPGVPAEDEGRWVFQYTHQITGVVITLETHGIDNWRAYEKQCIFSPKVYWNGSSCGEPELEHWAAPGFTAVKTFQRNAEEAS